MDSGFGHRRSEKDCGSDCRYSGEASCFDCRNVGLIVKMRADSAEEILRFSSGIFQQISTIFQQDFSAVFQWGLQMAEVGT